MRGHLLSVLAAATVLASVPCLAVLADTSPTTNATQAIADDVQDLVYLGETRPILVRLHIRVDGKSYLTAWNDFVKELFQQIDKNGDGVLSPEEVERMPPFAMLFSGGIGSMAAPTFSALDANKDGKVSLEELASMCRRQGGAPFQLQAGQDPNAQMMSPYSKVAPPVEALNDALFKLLDTNKDGKLSREELAQAETVLLKLDTDDDEIVTVDEVLPNYDPNLKQRVAAVSPRPMNRSADKGPVFLINPKDAPTALTRQIQTRYGTKGLKTKLTRKEIGLDTATFDLLDRDKDEELDTEELDQFSRRPPDLELVIELGAKAKSQAIQVVAHAKAPSPLAANVRTQPKQLVLDFGPAQVEVQIDTSNAGRQEPSALRETYKAQFRAADQDNNGYLDEMEAKRSNFFQGAFKLMDRDGDGKLFEKEMLAYLDAVLGLQAKAMSACVSLRVTDQGHGLFDLLDTNRDGKLGLREMRNAPKLIAQLDRNGDGMLSRNEVPKTQRITLARGTANQALGSVRVMAVRYGQEEKPVPALTAGPLWFRKMDRNRDGDVSRREFLGDDEEFRRLDTDGDGLISLEEAERADAKLRKSK